MLAMPLRIGRPRSLSPQSRHRNEFQHSPHPPSLPVKASQPSRDMKRRTLVCGKALNPNAVACPQSPQRHSAPGSGQLRNTDETALDTSNGKTRQLGMRLGDIDRDSQRLLKLKQREKIRKDPPKHSPQDGPSIPATRRSADDLSNVLIHSPINLSLPRVSSRQNSPCHSPARSRKPKLSKTVSDRSDATKKIRVVVKDFSHVVKSEPQRTASDSDLNKNETLLSPLPRKRSMSATSLFPKASVISELRLSDSSSRSATSSPLHAPTIQIEQCFDDLRLHSKDPGNQNIVLSSEARPMDKWLNEDDPYIPSDQGKSMWNSPTAHKSLLVDESSALHNLHFSRDFHLRRHLNYDEQVNRSALRPSKSESNLNSMDENRRVMQLPTPILVPTDRTRSTGDVAERETGDECLSSQGSSPSTSFLQLPTLKKSETLYQEKLDGLSRHSDFENKDVKEHKLSSPGRKASPPSVALGASKIPALPEVKLTLTNPRGVPRRTVSGPTVGSASHSALNKPSRRQTDGAVSYGFLSPSQGDIVSPPRTPLLPLSDQ